MVLLRTEVKNVCARGVGVWGAKMAESAGDEKKSATQQGEVGGVKASRRKTGEEGEGTFTLPLS